MSNISPNSLFHFTKKIEYLIDIFKRGFQPRFCAEKLQLLEYSSIRGYNLGIPMTCFCDISLGQISNHISMYGNYGIGMTKEWALKNKLNPLIYLNTNSDISEPLSSFAEIGLTLNNHTDKLVREKAAEILGIWSKLMMFSKPYSGEISQDGIIKNIKFYNEREWRYIPLNEKKLPVKTMSIQNMEDSILLEKENNKMMNHRLRFTPQDVKYIFVDNENEIHKLIENLRKIKSPHYNEKTIDILITKILTTRQIIEDF